MLGSLDQSVIKSLNRSRILRAFREKDIIQKKELVDLLNLSITTVTANTRQLLEEGLIDEIGIAESTGGRKPVVFKFMKNAKVSFGVDISPHRVTVILTNLKSEVISTEKFTVDKTQMNDILSRLLDLSSEMIANAGFEKSDCLGMGVSLPGIVDSERKVLVSAPNLHVTDYDFTEFEKRLGYPVYLENEANIAAFAELILGAAEKIQNAVYVSITDGVGCGIIANHQVTKGTFNKAGEFGHMRVSDKEILCSCGRRGCWELFSSERALFRNYLATSGEIITDLEVFFWKFHEGNLHADKALRKYLSDLHIGIENILLGLDPEVIIIGGEIAPYLRKLDKFVEAYFSRSHSMLRLNENKLVFSRIDPQSSVVGSSLLPLGEMFGF